jgi:putative phosphoesterase
MTRFNTVYAEFEKSSSPFEIGLVSDTHGLMRAEALEALAGCQHIVHAGDIGSPEILKTLSEIAPTTAVRGNNDRGDWAAGLPDAVMARFGDLFLYVIHDVADLEIDPVSAEIAVIVAGHSHQPSEEQRDGVFYLNPGSAGPKRFALPISVARLTLADGQPPRYSLLHLPV